jgi:hypothetical protein
MVIVHETLPEQLIEGRDKDESVRWVVSVNDVKPLTHEHKQRDEECSYHGVAILPEVTD